MLPVLHAYLKVLLRVPVAIVDDARVGGRQVDAQPTGPGGEEEDLDLWVLVEGLDVFLAVLGRRKYGCAFIKTSDGGPRGRKNGASSVFRATFRAGKSGYKTGTARPFNGYKTYCALHASVKPRVLDATKVGIVHEDV